MIKILCAGIIYAVLAVVTAFQLQADEVLTSPDGIMSVSFSIKDTSSVKGGLFWRVNYKNSVVMQDSRLGFVQEGSQHWTKWLHDSIKKAADYHMIVDAHDEYRMTGTERTYPNFLTCEGVRGNEGRPTPKQDLENVFLRSLCGPADFTMCWYEPSLKMSRAHQMAASVVYYSPLQTLYWYDQPKMFSGDEDYLEFFRALPTVWDEKRVIQGEIGEYITLARRKGDAWFVGTMNAIEHRRLDIPLTFLKPGVKYRAVIYSDSDPAEAAKSKSVKIKRGSVTSETIIRADMANNGGQAIYIVPESVRNNE